MNLEFKNQVWKTDFRSTVESHEFEEKLRTAYGMQYRYEAARLLIGLSLSENTPPDPLPQKTEYYRNPLPGELLFGNQIDLWICVQVLDGRFNGDATIEDFKTLVQAHWARGFQLVRDELERCEGDVTKLAKRLADNLPESIATDDNGVDGPLGKPGEIRLKVGTVSKTHPGKKPVDFVLNDPGTAPHLALMGRTRTGKTTTGVQIALEIASRAEVPILFIDPKGEFVNDNGQPKGALAKFGRPINAIAMGKQPLPLDFLPSSNAPDISKTRAAMRLRDAIALCCTAAGDQQKDLLRTAIENLINDDADHGLNTVNDYYQRALANANKHPDSIVARLNELTGLDCYEPSLSPGQFFSQSWIVSLKELPTEPRRLATLILLDAISAWVLEQSDSPVPDGYRTMRHLLVVDEAREVLQMRKSEPLSELIRKGGSKGSAVMLLSQDPSDFDGKDDDFLTQIGTVIAYACAQSQRGLKSLGSVFGRKLQANEFSDTQLEKGIAFVKLPGKEPDRIRCWQP